MKAKSANRPRISRAVVTFFLVLIIVFTGIGFYLGATYAPTTITKSVTTTVTTMPTPPPQVSVTGNLSTTGLGTSPAGITFTSSTTGKAVSGEVSGNTYTITLLNEDTYNVTIGWKTFINSGSCAAGTVALFVGYGESRNVTADWTC